MEAEEEFGTGITKPSNGWPSLSKPFEIAISAGPLILFKKKKLSSITTSKAKLATVSSILNKKFNMIVYEFYQHCIQKMEERNTSIGPLEKIIWKGLIAIATDGTHLVEERTMMMINEMKAFKLDSSAISCYKIKGEIITN